MRLTGIGVADEEMEHALHFSQVDILGLRDKFAKGGGRVYEGNRKPKTGGGLWPYSLSGLGSTGVGEVVEQMEDAFHDPPGHPHLLAPARASHHPMASHHPIQANSEYRVQGS